MKRFNVSENIQADCNVEDAALFGHLYHVVKNKSGGANLTPVALYFATRPEFIEGYNSHWRVNCFFRVHKLSPDPLSIGEALVGALKKENLCAEPIWLSVHRSEELEGKAYGRVFEDEPA